MILYGPSGVDSTTATAVISWGSFWVTWMAGKEASMEEKFGFTAPREEMEERGNGASAPRQPMTKRITSSLERQQNLLRLLVGVEDEEGRLALRPRLLLLLEASRFFSHLPL